MKEGTAIEWTHIPGYRGETWNPVTGCDIVSPGCAHCYALELAGRLKGMGQKRYQRDGDPKTSGPGFAVTLHPDKLDQPVRWRAPRAIFVNSMSDVFHEAIPDEYIGRMFAVMAGCPQHIFMVLTKRPERMRDVIRESSWEWSEGFARGWEFGAGGKAVHAPAWPLPNVWMGVTIENRRFVSRADILRKTPAAVRFISAEPLLGPLVLDGVAPDPEGGVIRHWKDHKPQFYNPPLDLTGIDWLIVGGESGPNHRRIDPEWVRDLLHVVQSDNDDILRAGREQEHEQFPRWWGNGTAFFFKQWGGRTPKAGGRELDGREWSEFPVAAVPA
jgi:protein gp37